MRFIVGIAGVVTACGMIEAEWTVWKEEGPEYAGDGGASSCYEGQWVTETKHGGSLNELGSADHELSKWRIHPRDTWPRTGLIVFFV
jgi:hypothetical protein